MSSKSSIVRHSIPVVPDQGRSKDEINKIQQDISTLTLKISQLSGENQIISTDVVKLESQSPFVSGLRSSTEKLKDPKIEKLKLMEGMLEKICEYDRWVLRKTAPESETPRRRGSKGVDLFLVPTHLHIVDRLFDLYNQSKRVTVIKTTLKGEPSTNVSEEKPVNTSNPADKKTIETLKITVAKLNKQLEEANASKLRLEGVVAKSQKDIEALQAAQNEANKKSENLKSKEIADECAQLSANLSKLTEKISLMQDKLDIESNRYQYILSIILGKASHVSNCSDISELKPTDSNYDLVRMSCCFKPFSFGTMNIPCIIMINVVIVVNANFL